MKLLQSLSLAVLVLAQAPSTQAMDFDFGLDTLGFVAQDVYETIPTPIFIGIEGLALAAVSYGTYQVGNQAYQVGKRLWKVGSAIENLTERHDGVITTLTMPVKVAAGVIKFFGVPASEKTTMIKQAWPNIKTASKNVVKKGWQKLTKKKE